MENQHKTIRPKVSSNNLKEKSTQSSGFSKEKLKEYCSTHPRPVHLGTFSNPIAIDQNSQTFSWHTSFVHSDLQDCCKWGPVDWTSEGDAGQFQNYRIEKKIESSDGSFHGPVTDIRGRVIYTCQKNRCQILCPCSLCQFPINNSGCTKKCRRRYPCKSHEIQCNEHDIKLERTFNGDTDQYTVCLLYTSPSPRD